MEMFNRLNNFSSHYKINNCHHYAILDSITPVNATLDSSIIQMATKIIKNYKNDNNARILASKTIHTICSRNSVLLEGHSIQSNLIELVLDINTNMSEFFDLEVKNYLFRSLNMISETIPDEVYVPYYANLKRVLLGQGIVNDTSKLREIEKHIVSDSEDKFNILLALSTSLSECKGKINIINIFNHFSSNQWSKELLLYTLLWKCLEKTKKWNICTIQKFIKKIRKLENFISNYNTTRSIEFILEMLIFQRNEIQYDLHQMNHFLSLILCSTESLRIVLQDHLHFTSKIKQLEIFWLRLKCNQLKIAYTDEELLQFKWHQSQYTIEAINHVLDNVPSGTSMSDLITLFNILNENEFKIISKNDLLPSCVLKNQNIHHCNELLYFYLAENIIKEEFPNYDYKTVENNSKSSVVIKYSRHIPKIDTTKPRDSKYRVNNGLQKRELKKIFPSLRKKEWLNSIFYHLNVIFSKLMFNHGWKVKNIKKLTCSLDTENKVIQLIKALEIVIDYATTDQNKLFSTILNSSCVDVQKNIHQFVLQRTFAGTYEKSMDQLLKELIDSNASILNLASGGFLLEYHREVMKTYNEKSSQFPYCGLIKEWGENVIKSWVQYKLYRTSTQYEKIAVIYRAVEVAHGIRPRDIQLLSVILFLMARDRDKGRLAQINTGEGKTTVIAMIAAYHAMEGHKVDIITSSPLLALPQSREQKYFYSLLGFTASCNANNNHSSYSADIVYGAANDFQADILREEYKKLNTRHGRKCDIAIVDEVDSMLIDGNNHIVKLSSTMPAMEHLLPVLGAIYMQINMIASSIVERDGKAYFVKRRFSCVNGKTQCKILGEDQIKTSKKEFIHKVTLDYIKDLIQDDGSNDIDKILIPKHLQEFVYDHQLEKWIEQAICGQFFYINGRHYILKNGKVTAVDVHNTGVIQESMLWSDGLHQFLQIKHGAKIQAESLTSNFISNVEFFRRYSSNIYGLTGTLGSDAIQELLNKTYRVDSIVVPPFKLKQHKELTAIVTSDENEWYHEVINSCLSKLSNGRAVLIITNYIEEIERLKEHFVKVFGYDRSKILIYKTNDDANVVNRTLDQGDVLITTNIAGRGTDIKVSSAVNNNGGLHVCLTFLPLNSRVEDQNKGRTGRIGNPGTSQFVLLAKNETKCPDIIHLKSNRDMKEKDFMKKAQKDIEIVTTKDALFVQFCKLLNRIEGRNSETRDIELTAVEERFALWMNLNDEKIETEPKQNIFENFHSFISNILQDDSRGCLIKNPYLHVKIGNNYMNQTKFKEAIYEYSLAIDLDPNFAKYAYFYKGYAVIAEYGQCDDNKEKLEEAFQDFVQARKLIDKRKSDLLNLRIASENEVFLIQIKNKMNLYDVLEDAVDEAIGCDQDAIDGKIKEFKSINENYTKAPGSRELASEIKRLEEKKAKTGILCRAIDKRFKLGIEYVQIDKILSKQDTLSYKDEIEVFEKNGFIGLFKIKKKMNWWNVFGLCFIGVAEIIIGVSIFVFIPVLATEIAVPVLVFGGIVDLYTATVDCIINDNFTWKGWGLAKATQLIATLATSGASIASNIASTTASNAQMVLKVRSDAFKKQCYNIGSIIAHKIGAETVKQVPNMAIHLTNEKFSKEIRKKIIDSIEQPLLASLSDNAMVKKMLELDKHNSNQHCEDLLKDMANKILNKNSNTDELRDLFLQIGSAIANHISAKNHKTELGLSAVLSVVKPLLTLNELRTLTSKFINELNAEIAQLGKEDGIEEVLNHAIAECDQHKVADGPTILDDSDVIIEKLKKEKEEQVKLEDENLALQTLSKTLVRDVSVKMEKIIRENMLSGFKINFDNVQHDIKIISDLTHEFNCYKETKMIIKVLEEIANFEPNDEIVSEEEDENKEESDDQQYKSLLQTLTDNTHYKSTSDVHLHLAAITRVIDKSIEVYDKNNCLKYIVGDNEFDDPLKIQYRQRDDHEIGYFTSIGENRAPTENHPANLNDLVAKLIGENPNDLRNTTISTLQSGSLNINHIKNCIKRSELYQGMKVFPVNTDNHENSYYDQKFIVNIDGSVDYFESVNDRFNINLACRYRTGYHTKFSCTAAGTISQLYDANGNRIYWKKND